MKATDILQTQHVIVGGLMRGLRGLLQDATHIQRRPGPAHRATHHFLAILERHDAAERRAIRRLMQRDRHSELLLRGFESGLDSLNMVLAAHGQRWRHTETIQLDTALFVRDSHALLDTVAARFLAEEEQVHPWLNAREAARLKGADLPSSHPSRRVHSAA